MLKENMFNIGIKNTITILYNIVKKSSNLKLYQPCRLIRADNGGDLQKAR